MKAVCVCICDYNQLYSSGHNIIVQSSNEPFNINDNFRVTHEKMGADMADYCGIEVRVTRVAVISGFDLYGEGLYIMEVVSVSLGLVKSSETVQ